MGLRAALHLLLHVLVPVGVARFAHRPLRAVLWMWAAMAVDLDHLLATPMYDPDRCSIEHHLLHQPLWWVAYGALALWPPTRWLGVGLLIHMALDGMDCLLM